MPLRVLDIEYAGQTDYRLRQGMTRRPDATRRSSQQAVWTGNLTGSGHSGRRAVGTDIRVRGIGRTTGGDREAEAVSPARCPWPCATRLHTSRRGGGSGRPGVPPRLRRQLRHGRRRGRRPAHARGGWGGILTRGHLVGGPGAWRGRAAAGRRAHRGVAAPRSAPAAPRVRVPLRRASTRRPLPPLPSPRPAAVASRSAG